MAEDLWTGFNGRKIAAERAKKDWNGNTIVPANDSTITIKVADETSGPTAGSFTTNQSSASTITIPAAASAPSGGSAKPGVMSAGDKEKLDKIVVANVEDHENWGHIKVTDTDGTVHDIDVYEHPTDGANTSAGDTTAQTPGFGGTFKALSATVDSLGHTTALSAHTVTIPNATAVASESGTGGSAGLMSAADKEKLDGVEAGAQANVKPDWNAAAGTDAEILNKPTIPSAPNDAALNLVLGSAQSTQVFSADAASAGTITIPLASVDNTGATPVYTEGLMTGQDKENLDNATAVIPSAATAQNQLVDNAAMQAAIANLGGYEVVANSDPTTHEPILPSGESASTKIIYLVKNTSASGSDKYYEWICTNTTGPVWELIGETSIDLTGYAKIPQSKTPGNIVEFGSTDELVDSGKTVAQLENVVTTVSIGGGTLIKPTANTTNIDIPVATNSSGTGTAGAMSGADKVKLDGIETGAQVNVLETISVNGGTPLSPGASKNIDLTVSVPSASSATPQMDATTGSAGSSTDYARADHVHPSDSAKADKVSGATADNFAKLDSNGNLADAGVNAGSFKTVQTAVADPTASGNATSFIDTITQNTNGEITVTKKTVPTVTASTSAAGGNDGLMTAQQAEALSILNTWTYDTFGDRGPTGTDTPVVFPEAAP